MNDDLPPVVPAPAVPDAGAAPDSDEEARSVDFARALEAFEHGSEGRAAQATRVASALVAGMKVRGTVVSIGDEHVMVDFGGRSEGVAETRHFRGEDGSVRLHVGDALDLFVVEAGEQVVLGPSVRAEAHHALRQLREAKAGGIPVSGKVTGVNAGGLSVDVGGARGFCPMSQIEAGFCADPTVHVGHTLEFLVTEIKDGRGGVVLSRKALLRRQEEESARQLLATLKPGDEREGTVSRLEPFGAFVDLGGLDGLVHVSEIRHERTHHPREALREGQQVHVRVLRIETGKDGRPRIALSIKASAPDPWVGVESRIAPGARVRGTVVRLADFGAFVNLAPGIDGLVHVSEIALTRTEHVKDALTVGQEVEALVLGVDPAKRRIALSIKAVLRADLPPGEAPPERPARSERPGRPRGAHRPDRGDRGDRGGRAERGPRSARGESPAPREPRPEAPPPARPAAEPELTTMALALRKAIEEAKKREGGA